MLSMDSIQLSKHQLIFTAEIITMVDVSSKNLSKTSMHSPPLQNTDPEPEPSRTMPFMDFLISRK